MNENIWIYDCEVFAHDWIFVAKRPDESGEQVVLHNDPAAFRWWADSFGRDGSLVIGGYNTKHYDQWIIKAIYFGATPEEIKKISDFIIAGGNGWDHPFFAETRWPPWMNFDLMDDIPVPLRLKEIEGNLGMDIEESKVSFDIDRPLTEEERNEVIRYCCHDVDAAIRLYHERKDYLQSKIAVGAMCGLSAGESLRLTNAKLTAEFLGAQPPQTDWPDRDVYEFPENLIITKYPQVIEFFADVDPERKRKLKIDIAGVPHTIAWGGLHGARECYREERTETRRISSRDVTSYYPSLMIVNGYMSRNVPDPGQFKRVYERRIEAKKAGDKATADALKLVLNTTFGAMNNQFNKLYDPRMALAVCVSGQLYLIDLIEKLEEVPSFRLIQSNTDGLIISYDAEHETEIDAVIDEWSQRTGFGMEATDVEKIVQKDVNNYVLRTTGGEVKVKGPYLAVLDAPHWRQNSMKIVAKAIVENLLNGVPPEETIGACDDMEQFQIITKAGNTYDKVIWRSPAGEVEVQNVNRVFASINEDAGTLYKVKLPKAPGEKERRDKIADLPEHCFIANRQIDFRLELLDKQFYIDLAKKRINDYLGVKPEKPAKKERKKTMATKTKATETAQVQETVPADPRLRLYQKLAKLQQIMDSFEWTKDGKNRHQSYEYITEKQYKNNFKKARAEAGLLWKMEEIGHEFIGTISDKMHLVLTKFRGRLIDPETGEFEEYLFSGSGADNGDKALYKAYTGGLKFFLASNFLVAEGNDPENDEEEMRQLKPAYATPERREEIRGALTNQDEPATEEQLEAIALGIEELQKAGVDEETIAGFAEALESELTKADAEKLLDAITELTATPF
jgi:hypothetical protein